MKKVQLFLMIAFVFNLSDVSGSNGLVTDKDIYEGKFEVKLTEGMNKTITGTAEFIHTIAAKDDEDDIGSTLTMTLANGAGDIITILVGDIEDLDGINPGSYIVDLEPDEGVPVAIVGLVVNKSMGFIGSSGRVEITKINNTRVVGAVNATLMGDDGKTITLTGTFEAVAKVGSN